ncbi:MAG: AAA family ATPase, partial [Mycobacteriaceae bacterium]
MADEVPVEHVITRVLQSVALPQVSSQSVPLANQAPPFPTLTKQQGSAATGPSPQQFQPSAPPQR